MASHIRAPQYAAGLFTAVFVLSAPLAAYGVTFEVGELSGQFDTNLSVGASWAMQNPDKQFIGIANGGTSSDANSDDGRLNFKRGETFSKIFKGVHDLELRYGNTGVFVRGKYWYDFELKDEGRRFVDISDSNRKTGAQSSGAQVLDAFLYQNYRIGERDGTFRLGRQVLSWGESTFISGGINSVNPFDVAAFRRPGAQIKEGLIPVNLAYFSQSIADGLSLEAFYQLEWDQTVVDNCGTFFALDNIADGCNINSAGPNLTDNFFARAALEPMGVQLDRQGIVIPRSGDRDARDSGQWGVSLRKYVESVDAELGAYVMNYHSRMPYYSVTTGPHTADLNFVGTLCGNLGVSDPTTCGAIASQLGSAYRLGSASYYLDYPEDIRLYGMSFSTTLPTGTALSGELTYRPNAPLQMNGVDVTHTVLGEPLLTPLYASGLYEVGNNQRIKGYQRKEVTQLQMTAVHMFDRVLGAERLTVVGEAAVVRVGGLGGKGHVRFGRDAGFGGGELSIAGVCQGVTNVDNARYCNNEGFTTRTAWGYRATAVLDYSNVVAGINLRPNLSWSHDVSGYGPTLTPFVEGAKAISIGLDADLDATYNASISYTNFFDGKYNTQVDRDFLAVSVGVSF